MVLSPSPAVVWGVCVCGAGGVWCMYDNIYIYGMVAIVSMVCNYLMYDMFDMYGMFGMYGWYCMDGRGGM